jgi:hypothetical protein
MAGNGKKDDEQHQSEVGDCEKGQADSSLFSF